MIIYQCDRCGDQSKTDTLIKIRVNLRPFVREPKDRCAGTVDREMDWKDMDVCEGCEKAYCLTVHNFTQPIAVIKP